jgi:hypothetical protein
MPFGLVGHGLGQRAEQKAGDVVIVEARHGGLQIADFRCQIGSGAFT